MESRTEQQRLRRHVIAAREQERGRWARELHDDTLQTLGALRLRLATARSSDDGAILRDALDLAVDELGREIANLRSLITELRPAALDQLGLAPALAGLLDRSAGRHGVTVRATVQLQGQPSGRVDEDIETAVYRVVQEALSNAARHARAQNVAVEVLEADGMIAVRVADDGCGFDVEAPTGGFGLLGMRERVALAGGRLSIQSTSAGTVVAAQLPAQRSGAAVREIRPALAASAG